MTHRLLLAGLAAGLLTLGVGCRHSCRKAEKDCGPPPRTGGGFLDDPVPTRGSTIPPAGVPIGPPDSLPPPVVPDSRGSYRIDPSTPPGPWDPSAATRFDVPPVPRTAPPTKSAPEVLLPDSDVARLPSTAPDRRPVTSGFLEAPVKPSSPGAAARTPVGLDGFAQVPGRTGVGAGRKPSADGLDGLKTAGYRTLIYLHAPSVDPTALRADAEKRGLKFVPIAVSPGTLKRAYDEFAVAVGDASSRPVYVADDDGVRTGSLFYLLFRSQDLMSDDAARVRATPLGLTDAGTAEQTQFWVAVQDVLAKR